MTQASTRVQQGNSRTADKFVVRLPEGMRSRITEMSQSQYMSMNSYVIRALAVALQTDEHNPEVFEQHRPSFAPGMPCRLEGNVYIIDKIYFFNSVLTCDIVNAEGEAFTSDYDVLEAF